MGPAVFVAVALECSLVSPPSTISVLTLVTVHRKDPELLISLRTAAVNPIDTSTPLSHRFLLVLSSERV